MTTGLNHVQPRPLRAPSEDCTALIEPALDQIGPLLAENRADQAQCAYDLQGRPLARVALEARSELLALARRWTCSYRDLDLGPLDSATPIVMAGHQPELFHPGVWLKNFALDLLAHEHHAVAINLLVDNDTMKSAALRVPGGSVAEPRVASILMDRQVEPLPYEERQILDRAMFLAFSGRVAEQIASLVPDPMIKRYWPMVIQRSRETDNLGACLAQARHQIEGQWGTRTWEVPVSWLCQTESFAWFVAHLLAQLRRFRQVYNDVLQAYRKTNRVRSTAHPAPDLADEDPWLEAPLWIWTEGDPRRRRLFVRRRTDAIILSDRRQASIELPLRPDGDGARAAARLMELPAQGVKIRCRALITTLWARLVLSDLFVHGIGGAKYDQVTDALIARFFGRRPPGFQVVSATLYLPVARPTRTRENLQAIQRQLREIAFHPEKYVDRQSATCAQAAKNAQELIAEKLRWIHAASGPEAARRRFVEIRRINQALQAMVAGQRQRLLEDRQRASQAVRAEAILGSREYAYCLFPEPKLREFLGIVLPKRAC